jgi:hypothetical protein
MNDHSRFWRALAFVMAVWCLAHMSLAALLWHEGPTMVLFWAALVAINAWTFNRWNQKIALQKAREQNDSDTPRWHKEG